MGTNKFNNSDEHSSKVVFNGGLTNENIKGEERGGSQS